MLATCTLPVAPGATDSRLAASVVGTASLV
jgi:hypothetical protein